MPRQRVREEATPVPPRITRVTVGGFKSIQQEQSIEIRPLTLLAGANSSGKSSMMQPLLLLKQTLDATYDPGPLLLDGPNAQFTSVEQFLSLQADGHRADGFSVGILDTLGMGIATRIGLDSGRKLRVERTAFQDGGREAVVQPGMPQEDLQAALEQFRPGLWQYLETIPGEQARQLAVAQQRCFLDVVVQSKDARPPRVPGGQGADPNGSIRWMRESVPAEDHIPSVIHVPGLRRNVERACPVGGLGSGDAVRYPGTFEHYVASIIADWQDDYRSRRLEGLNRDLELLGLTWAVAAKPSGDSAVELRVGRLPHRQTDGAKDMVSIADVGFGVSQVLPVLVALRVAVPGQLVYLEQPELHLHPRAQSALAQVLGDAARRGVHVVAETHSSLLLLAVQTLVAEGKLSPSLVKLHWFTRGEDGSTGIISGDLDESGAFGEWPEDFGDVEAQAESRYLDAAEARQRKDAHAQHSLASARH